MAAVADPKRELDLARLARDLDDSLPSYARPLFLRIVNDIDMTSQLLLYHTSAQSHARRDARKECTRDDMLIRY